MSPSDDELAIGPPSSQPAASRQSPTLALGPTARVGPTDRKRSPVTVVAAAGHLLNDQIIREIGAADGVELVGRGGAPAEAEAAIVGQVPQVALVGVDLGRDPDAVLQLCVTVREELPAVALVAVADTDRPEALFPCILNGAISCYLTKAPAAPLLDTIAFAHRREAVLPPGVAAALLEEYERLDADDSALLAPAPHLTPTEDDILRRLAAGADVDAVADAYEAPARVVRAYVGDAVARLHRTVHDDTVLRMVR
jgi:DNA-binding NarL/FixJ family response regulator